MADLVGDLAGLHVPLRVVAGRLHRAEPAQRPARELRVARDRLHRDDERVPPEQRHEPRHAGRRDDDAALEGRVLEAERLEVADRLVPGALDGLVRRLDARPSAGAATSAAAAASTALHGSVDGRPASTGGDRQPLQAGVPDALRRRSWRRRRAGRWRTAAASRPCSTAMISSRRKSPFVVRRPELAARPEPAGVDARRAGRACPRRTSKMSAKSESIAISIVRRTGRRA